ncbi:MAG: hypothetical protein K5765_01675 [Clostridia bacterium]|nr:hypothetical protein [Clostridia bacterium]
MADIKDIVNPEASEAEVKDKESGIDSNIGVKIKKCPSCGANMHYDPSQMALVCDYCSTVTPVDFSHGSSEIAFSKLLDKEANSWASETRVYKCSNCGASSIMPRRRISDSCPFCGTANISETDDIPGLKPNAVIPFELTKDQALGCFYKWTKKKLLSPGKYKKHLRAEDVSGNYIPAFTFDTNTYTSYYGRLGEYYYVTVKDSQGNTHSERRVRYKNISGNHSQSFDDLLVQATEGMANSMVSKIEPFNTNASREYNEDFILGYTATMYTKEGTTCWTEAKKRMESMVQSAILSKYTYDFVDSFHMDMHCSNTTYKYVLLPVYIVHTRYKNKLYNFFVNGETGRITGKTPKSAVRVSLLVLGIMAVVAAIVLIGYFLGGQ